MGFERCLVARVNMDKALQGIGKLKLVPVDSLSEAFEEAGIPRGQGRERSGDDRES